MAKDDDFKQDYDENEEVGIPENLKIKRRYTVSEKALQQRRAAAKKPKGPGVARNNWKHGLYAKSYIQNKIRPCKSTCSKYPCELVEDGATSPGDHCLDKKEVIETYGSIMEAIQNKNYESFNEVAAMKMAEMVQIISMQMEDIIRDGTIVKSEKIDKEGKVIGYDIKPHPSLTALPKLIADLKLTPDEFLITPRSINKDKNEEDGVRSLADIMSNLGRNNESDS